jgi:hypothetical protein
VSEIEHAKDLYTIFEVSRDSINDMQGISEILDPIKSVSLVQVKDI